MKQVKTILVNCRYLIYTDNWVIYDTQEGEDIPQYVFKLMEKIQNNENTKTAN